MSASGEENPESLRAPQMLAEEFHDGAGEHLPVARQGMVISEDVMIEFDTGVS